MIKKHIGRIIWNASEWAKVPLGCFAPTVFGWMIDSKPIKKKGDQNP